MSSAKNRPTSQRSVNIVILEALAEIILYSSWGGDTPAYKDVERMLNVLWEEDKDE